MRNYIINNQITSYQDATEVLKQIRLRIDDNKNKRIDISVRHYINYKKMPRLASKKPKIHVQYDERRKIIDEILADGKLIEYLYDFMNDIYENEALMTQDRFSTIIAKKLSCLDELADYLLVSKAHKENHYRNEKTRRLRTLSVSRFKHFDNDEFSRRNFRKGRKHNNMSIDDVFEMTSLNDGNENHANENTIYNHNELIEERELLESILNKLDDDEEKNIVKLIVCGCRTADICRKLNLSESKVNVRKARIRDKIAVFLDREQNTSDSKTTKLCRKCNRDLPLDCFGKAVRNTKNGRKVYCKSYCKDCLNTEKRYNYNKINNVV